MVSMAPAARPSMALTKSSKLPDSSDLGTIRAPINAPPPVITQVDVHRDIMVTTDRPT